MDFQYFACFYASSISSNSWHERKGKRLLLSAGMRVRRRRSCQEIGAKHQQRCGGLFVFGTILIHTRTQTCMLVIYLITVLSFFSFSSLFSCDPTI